MELGLSLHKGWICEGWICEDSVVRKLVSPVLCQVIGQHVETGT